jgi:hypothetical protein
MLGKLTVGKRLGTSDPHPVVIEYYGSSNFLTPSDFCKSDFRQGRFVQI